MEHGLLSMWASVVVARRLSSCGSRALECRLSSCGARALLLHSMWDLPGPGLKPMSPALAGRFLTTVPPEKSHVSSSFCFGGLYVSRNLSISSRLSNLLAYNSSQYSLMAFCVFVLRILFLLFHFLFCLGLLLFIVAIIDFTNFLIAFFFYSMYWLI